MKASPHFDAVVAGLLDWGIERLVHVPSSHAAPVIRGLVAAGVPAVMANREEEAVGIAGGMALAGVRSAIVMQDNGFGNALTALTTFAVAYHVPLPVVANVRGGIGEYNSMIQTISGVVPEMLRAAGVHVERLRAAEPVPVWRSTVRGAADLAQIQRRPVVALYDALHPALEVSA